MSRSVLRQFLLAIALIVLWRVISSMHYMTAHPQFAERGGGLARSLFLGIPGDIFLALPIAAAVALSVLPIGPGAFRQGMLLAGGVTALLVVNDLAARPLWAALEREIMGPGAFNPVRSGRFDDTTSALGGSLAHLLGRVQVEDIQKWPPDTTGRSDFRPITDPRRIVRSSAVYKYSEACALFLPLLAAGLVLGLGVWLRRIATFRTARDERVLRLTLGWVLSFTSVFGVMMLQNGMGYELSSPRVSMLWLMIPFAVVAVPSLLGWRAARRLDTLGAE